MEEHDFGWALSQLRAGKIVRRKDWKNMHTLRGMRLRLHKEDLEIGDRADPARYYFIDPDQALDTQTDILATDWEIADDVEV